MVRFLAFSSLLVVVASPVTAASYTAKLAAPTTQRIIARDVTWQCGADACQGATAESRPVVLCESLAKHAGKVDSFLVDGRAFSEAELATCNAALKVPAAKALAAQ
jgi:hypothetical protein